MSDWKDLTDYEIEAIHVQDQFWNDYWDEYIGEGYEELDPGKFALAIQEALKVKNEEMACIKLLAEIRFACGDNGKRMQDELVQYIAELYRQAESVPESWRSTMKELSDDLESEIESRRSRKIDPRIERDLIVVKEARALLAESNPESLESERAMNEELTHEIDMLQDSLIWQGKMLAAIANVIKGPPEEGSLHSTHDVVECVTRLQARVQLEQAQE